LHRGSWARQLTRRARQQRRATTARTDRVMPNIAARFTPFSQATLTDQRGSLSAAKSYGLFG
jgi:hypothetical protein